MDDPGDSKIAPELSKKLACCLLRASSGKEEPSECNKRNPPIIICIWIKLYSRGGESVEDNNHVDIASTNERYE